MKTYYLNTDLCLVSTSDLTPLAVSVGKKVTVGYFGKHGRKWHATINANGSGHIGKRDPTDDVILMLKVFGNLRGSARSLWKGCKRREMNIGWQSSDKRPEGAFQIEPYIITELAKQNIILAVTIYPSCENYFP